MDSPSHCSLLFLLISLFYQLLVLPVQQDKFSLESVSLLLETSALVLSLTQLGFYVEECPILNGQITVLLKSNSHFVFELPIDVVKIIEFIQKHHILLVLHIQLIFQFLHFFPQLYLQPCPSLAVTPRTVETFPHSRRSDRHSLSQPVQLSLHGDPLLLPLVLLLDVVSTLQTVLSCTFRIIFVAGLLGNHQVELLLEKVIHFKQFSVVILQRVQIRLQLPYCLLDSPGQQAILHQRRPDRRQALTSVVALVIAKTPEHHSVIGGCWVDPHESQSSCTQSHLIDNLAVLVLMQVH